MTQSPQPGHGWTSSAGEDAWTPATHWDDDDAGHDAPVAGGGHGQTLQGFGEVNDGYGVVSFGNAAAPGAALATTPRPSPSPAPLTADPALAPAGGYVAPPPAAAGGYVAPPPAAAGGYVAPPPAAAGGYVAESHTEQLTCPECGTTSVVALNRRESNDFCRTCDYPLFWTPSKVIRSNTGTDESLRRLPGTEGRATLASLPCPHCSEPNPLSAQVCVRCGLPMRAVAPPPPPEPEPILERIWEPEPEPEPVSYWWIWLLLGLGLTAVVVLVVLRATGVIG